MESQVFQAKLKNLRISPRKVRLVADAIRGRDVIEALDILELTFKRSATPLYKLVKSVAANAENQSGLRAEQLVISRIEVGEGPVMKRFMPRAQGRATLIRKRTSHITIEVSSPVAVAAPKKEVKNVSKSEAKAEVAEKDAKVESSSKESSKAPAKKSAAKKAPAKKATAKKETATKAKAAPKKPAAKKSSSDKAESKKK
jgi:large subunit ribosomal protein L22